MKGYTFYKGVKNYKELNDYIDRNETGDMPECESFRELMPGDHILIKDAGYIATESFDDEIYKQLPRTLKEALK